MSRVTRAYLTCGFAVVAAYPLLPAGPLKDSVVFDLAGLSAVLAIGAGLVANRPARRLPWLLLLAGQALFVAGDTAFSIYEHVLDVTPFPSAADGLYLAGYPVLAAGLLLVARRQAPGQDWASLLDTGVVAVGLGTLSWAFMMAPYVHRGGLSLAALLISLAYPLADLVLLGVTVRLFTSAPAKTPSLLLVGLSLATLLVTDTVYGILNLSDSYRAGSALDTGWMLSYVLIGAAGLHPSMTRLEEPAGTADERYPPWRIAVVAAAFAAVPVGVFVQQRRHAPLELPVFAAAALVLIALGMTRLARVIDERERLAAREHVLREAALALVGATDRRAICEAAVRFGLRLSAREPGVRATVALGSLDRATIVAAAGLHAERFAGLLLPAFGEEVQRALRAHRVVDVPPAMLDEIALDPHAEVIAAPILVRETVAGVLGLRFDRTPSPETRQTAAALAAQVSLALESAALGEEAHRRRSDERFRSLVQNSSDLIILVDADTTVRYQTPSVTAALGDLLGRKLSTIVHPGDFSKALRLVSVATSSDDPQPAYPLRLRARDGAYRETEVAAQNLLHDDSVGAVVLTARDVTERNALEQELARKAFHDGLTDLANRELYVNRLQHSLERRHGPPVAAVFIDLDDFKAVNDSLGHAAGDALLIQVAERLRETVRREDTVARLGGDEFAVLREGVGTGDEASHLAARIVDTLAGPMQVGGRQVFCSASAGVALGTPGATDGEQLLQAADLALYEAKRTGKGRHLLFQPAMQEALVHRLELKTDLRHAIDRGELVLSYQPIIALSTGATVGLEALARWHHPRRGILGPAEFIPLAEETGLIVPLGGWCLGEACQQLRAWQRRYPSEPPLWVSVNVSVRQIERPELVDQVAGALEASAVRPGDLVLEITESVLVEDGEEITDRLAALKRLGVRLAIDDFGTGYSALSYLRRLPVDIVKIDKQFIDDLQHETDGSQLAAAIVRLSRLLDLDVIAEGIEAPIQSRQLSSLRCRLGQGFLYSGPLTPDRVETRLAGEHERHAARSA